MRHHLSRSKSFRYLAVLGLCVGVWYVARASEIDISVAGPTPIAVASDESNCGHCSASRHCGEHHGEVAESSEYVSCCDQEHSSKYAPPCEPDCGDTPEVVLELMERLAPESLNMTECLGVAPVPGETMVGDIGVPSTGENNCRELMRGILRELDAKHHVRAACVTGEAAGCTSAEEICTPPAYYAPQPYTGQPPREPCAAYVAALPCPPCAPVVDHCSAGESCVVQSYPCHVVPPVAPVGPHMAGPPMHAVHVCYPVASTPTKWEALRDSSDGLEDIARLLEEAELYEKADRLRELSHELRREARSARRADRPTVGLQAASTACGVESPCGSSKACDRTAASCSQPDACPVTDHPARCHGGINALFEYFESRVTSCEGNACAAEACTGEKTGAAKGCTKSRCSTKPCCEGSCPSSDDQSGSCPSGSCPTSTCPAVNLPAGCTQGHCPHATGAAAICPTEATICTPIQIFTEESCPDAACPGVSCPYSASGCPVRP